MEKNTTPKKTVVNSVGFSNEAYQSWVSDICTTIETAKLQASLKVNADLLKLYFTIGKKNSK